VPLGNIGTFALSGDSIWNEIRYDCLIGQSLRMIVLSLWSCLRLSDVVSNASDDVKVTNGNWSLQDISVKDGELSDAEVER
jgi:hypothetical protein